MRPDAIVGIDAGASTAVAILDLKGNIVKLRSSKGFSLSKILHYLSKECSPIIIATDVSPSPKLIHKVAAAFSLRVHEPEENLSRKAKTRLVRPYKISGREKHKKDALAASIHAYGTIIPMLTRIENRIIEEGLIGKVAVEDVARKIIRREYRNIYSAIKSVKKT